MPIGACEGLGSRETDKRIVAACPYAWPWNVLGWPGLNVPAGFTPEGLPLGAQRPTPRPASWRSATSSRPSVAGMSAAPTVLIELPGQRVDGAAMGLKPLLAAATVALSLGLVDGGGSGSDSTSV